MAPRIALAGVAPRPRSRSGSSARTEPAEKLEPGPSSSTPLSESVFLNIDILELVLDKLDVADLCTAAQTSREWRAAASAAERAWQQAFVAKFGAEKATEFTQLRGWRDRYIACLLHNTQHRLRSKARYFDELEDSTALLEKNAQALLAGLNQMDRTLSHRRHDLNALLASVTGKRSANADSKLGKEVLELASKDGDLARFPRLTPDTCIALLEMQRDVEFWKTSIAEERDSLHRMWDSLSYINNCTKKARSDISALQRRRAALERATRYRPTVRRT